MDFKSIKSIWDEKKWKNLKKSDWVVVGLVGVLLLVLVIPLENENDSQQESAGSGIEEMKKVEGDNQNQSIGTTGTTEQNYVEYLEENMEEVLSQMEGVGRVEVMITVSDMGESVVEKDRNTVQSVTTETDSAGGDRSVSETSVEETTIYIESDDETYPYIQKEKMPTIEGVVVVAEGGGSSSVVSNISESVKALLPVEVHRIKVVKMCSKEE